MLNKLTDHFSPQLPQKLQQKHPQPAWLLNRDNASINNYKNLMTQAVGHVADWLDDSSMYSGRSVESLFKHIQLTVTDQGLGHEQAVSRAVDYYLSNSLKVHHPHCVAHLHCPTLVISQVAELLMNASNQSMDSWDQSPSATIMEIKLIEWLREKVGYQAGDAGVFTSGGTQSNLMGLLLARDAVVQRTWQRSVQHDGLPADASRIRVICSDQAHFSVQKNMALLGLGYQAVVAVSTNAAGQMDIAALQHAIETLEANGDVVAAIVATAGTTDSGAIDPLQEIAAIAKQHQIWLHVDAAWGGALLLSKRFHQRLNGLQLADSITLDFHKHFFQPISCGAFLLKNPQHFQLMHYQADYLNSMFDELQGVPNLVSKSLQTTRRFDALKLWMSLEALGADQFALLVDHGIDLAQQVSSDIEQDDALQLMVQPQLASVLFRVNLSRCEADQLDQLNQCTADNLLAAGLANVGVTSYQQRTCLKLTLLNPSVTRADIQQLLALVKEQASQVAARLSSRQEQLV